MYEIGTKEMLNDYRKLIATRKENKDAFVYGAFEEVASNKVINI